MLDCDDFRVCVYPFKSLSKETKVVSFLLYSRGITNDDRRTE